MSRLDKLRRSLSREAFEERIESELGTPVMASSAAYANEQASLWGVALGVAAAFLLVFVFAIGPLFLVQGFAIAIGLGLGMVVGDVLARRDPGQPGGSTVGLVVTETELIVIHPEPWNSGTIAGRVALDEINAINVGKRIGTHVEIELSYGASWEYLVRRWDDLEAALPEHLITH